MNDFDDLDDLFGPLRSAATDAELAGEASHVDAMAHHHRRQKGHTMLTSRRARVAMFVAAGVIGFGGVAAAGPRGPFASTGSDDTSTTTEVTTTISEVTTTSSEVTTTTSEVPLDGDLAITRSVIEQTIEGDDTELVDDAVTDFDVTTCLGHDPALFDNHGEFVSQVARGVLDIEEFEQRDAAQSPCGKDDKDDKHGDDDDVDEVKDDDDDGDGDGDDGDDDSDDDDDDDEGRPDKSDRSEKSEKPGNRGNGPKKNAGD